MGEVFRSLSEGQLRSACAGPYKIPDEEHERRLLELAQRYGVRKEVLEAERRRLHLKIMAEINEVLKAGGCPITITGDNTTLWAVGRYMGLSDEQLNNLTPDGFMDLARLHFPAKTISEASSPETTEAIESLEDFSPAQTALIRAWRATGIAASYKVVCEYIDKHIGTMCPYGNKSEWAPELKGSDKGALKTFINRTKALFPRDSRTES